MHPTIAEIDLNIVRSNLRAIRDRMGAGVRVMPVVKANAYGHGAVVISRIALEAGADMLGVACVDEAAELRDAGVACPILILGSSPVEFASDVVERCVTSTVCDMSFASALSACAVERGTTAQVHVKIDTGMGRIGVVPKEAPQFILDVLRLPAVELTGVFTHFPSADEDDPEFTNDQIREFSGVLTGLRSARACPIVAHTANSGAILDHPGSHLDMVRPGLLMYGSYPSPTASRSIAVRQALTLKTRITFIKDVGPGASVSYGRTYRAKRMTKVATIPIGYADGFSRFLSSRGHVLVHGQRVPVIGRVCMDQTMLDVTDVRDVDLGDEVVIYGSQGAESISVAEVAELVGTVPHDILCAVGQRIPRIYHGA